MTSVLPVSSKPVTALKCCKRLCGSSYKDDACLHQYRLEKLKEGHHSNIMISFKNDWCSYFVLIQNHVFFFFVKP